MISFDTDIGHYGDWSTLDNDSLRINNPPGWQKALELRNPDPQRFGLGDSGIGLVDAYFAYGTFEIDVLLPDAEWQSTGSGWAQLELICNSQSGGWNGMGAIDLALGENHLVWDYSGHGSQPTDGWIEFILATNNGDWDISSGNYYIDRAVLTPEPATIALLGLGGLALLRRKR